MGAKDAKELKFPEDLEERDTTSVLSLYGRNRQEIQKQKWRDLLKHAIIKATKTTVFVLLEIENEAGIELQRKRNR